MQRVVEGTWYPFEAKETTISIGHMRRDMFFSLYQLQQKRRELAAVQTTNKQITTRKMQGVVNTDRNNIQSDNKLFQVIKDLLYIDDRSGTRRVNLGNVDKADEDFVFELFNKLGIKTLYVDSETGNAIFSGTIRGGKIEADTDIAVDRDVYIGQNLKVGYKSSYIDDDGETRYKWYSDSSIHIGPYAEIYTENDGHNLVLSSETSIELNAHGKVFVMKKEVATKEYVDQAINDALKALQ